MNITTDENPGINLSVNYNTIKWTLRSYFIYEKYIAEKMILKFKDDLLWFLMTFEVILYLMKNLRLVNISIHRKF